MKKEKKSKEKQKINFLKKYYYIFIIIGVLILTIICVYAANNKLNNDEQKLYDIIEKNKNSFKNPESLKVLSAKLCNDDYSIIEITAHNSFGAETTAIYYVNKNVMTADETIAKAVAEKCYEEELNNYDSVIILSEDSIAKINNRIGGNS